MDQQNISQEMLQYLRLANAVDGKNPDGKLAHTLDEGNVKLLRALLNSRQAEICAVTSIKNG